MRKTALTNEITYHVFTKSIAEYKIFNDPKEYSRMMDVIKYYGKEKPEMKFSRYAELRRNNERNEVLSINRVKDDLVKIIAYCIMPTHIHLILRQEKKDGISIYMDRILGSHTRYFNIANDRKGPLWEGKFKNVMVDKDEYLYHLTRYIHLNPVTAHLVEKPEDWIATSYNEYISKDKKGICSFEDALDITPNLYRDFVEERIEFQRNLAKIKRFMMD